MTERAVIITTVTNFNERRGPINRLDMLIEYYENFGLDVEIVSVGLRRPNITFYRHLSVSWTPICLLDIFYWFYYILALYPISVIVFQRKKIKWDGDVICFHLVRAIQLNVIRNEKKKY